MIKKLTAQDSSTTEPSKIVLWIGIVMKMLTAQKNSGVEAEP